MKRGFKSQCERRSVEVRKAMDLRPYKPLDAFKLADANNVVVWSESDIASLSHNDIAQLCIVDKENWLAFVIRLKQRYLIVHNSSHSIGRTNSLIMHEMSHILLGHELTSPHLTENGHLVPTNYNQDQEDEANWLAGTLLLPRPALLEIRRERMTDLEAQQYYKVSASMLTWRFKMTGVDYQLAHRRRTP